MARSAGIVMAVGGGLVLLSLPLAMLSGARDDDTGMDVAMGFAITGGTLIFLGPPLLSGGALYAADALVAQGRPLRRNSGTIGLVAGLVAFAAASSVPVAALYAKSSSGNALVSAVAIPASLACQMYGDVATAQLLEGGSCTFVVDAEAERFVLDCDEVSHRSPPRLLPIGATGDVHFEADCVYVEQPT